MITILKYADLHLVHLAMVEMNPLPEFDLQYKMGSTWVPFRDVDPGDLNFEASRLKEVRFVHTSLHHGDNGDLSGKVNKAYCRIRTMPAVVRVPPREERWPLSRYLIGAEIGQWDFFCPKTTPDPDWAVDELRYRMVEMFGAHLQWVFCRELGWGASLCNEVVIADRGNGSLINRYHLGKVRDFLAQKGGHRENGRAACTLRVPRHTPSMIEVFDVKDEHICDISLRYGELEIVG